MTRCTLIGNGKDSVWDGENKNYFYQNMNIVFFLCIVQSYFNFLITFAFLLYGCTKLTIMTGGFNRLV